MLHTPSIRIVVRCHSHNNMSMIYVREVHLIACIYIIYRQVVIMYASLHIMRHQ